MWGINSLRLSWGITYETVLGLLMRLSWEGNCSVNSRVLAKAKTPRREGARGWSLALVAMSLFFCGIVKGDVLYDTTDMTDNKTFDTGGQAFIGGAAFYGSFRDVQATDDFDLDSPHEITSVTGDYGTFFGTPPADGVLVELFEDIDGTPSESPTIAILSSDVTVIPLDDLLGFPSFRLIANLPERAVCLDAGTWWIAITPVDETPKGDGFFPFGSTAGNFGNNTHFRDGGVDHGNGYPGSWGVDDWTLPHLIGNLDDLDLAMKIEGTRLADLDGDGFVGAADLLMLLSSWGSCPPKGDCPADLDGNGSVGAGDLLILLSQWG